MSKGYMEGPAAEEAERRREEAEQPTADQPAPDRQAVYGSTEADGARHFLGWLGEVDPDELFASGEAWGISVMRVRADDRV
jgi:hypothetical protein